MPSDHAQRALEPAAYRIEWIDGMLSFSVQKPWDDPSTVKAITPLYALTSTERAPPALAATPAVGGEAVAWLVPSDETGFCRIWWRDKERAEAWLAKHPTCTLMPLYAAPPASPLRGMEDLAPSPCSDLSIGELIEWLDNPQWTNGYLNSDAANHMSAAAELLEKFLAVSASPPEQPAAAPPRPLAEWHEDMGDQLWWWWMPANYQGEGPARWAGEPPYCGSPLDLGITVEAHTTTRIISQMDQEHEPAVHIERVLLGGWPGYHTHFTPLPPMPEVPNAPAPPNP